MERGSGSFSSPVFLRLYWFAKLTLDLMVGICWTHVLGIQGSKHLVGVCLAFIWRYLSLCSLCRAGWLCHSHTNLLGQKAFETAQDGLPLWFQGPPHHDILGLIDLFRTCIFLFLFFFSLHPQLQLGAQLQFSSLEALSGVPQLFQCWLSVQHWVSVEFFFLSLTSCRSNFLALSKSLFMEMSELPLPANIPSFLSALIFYQTYRNYTSWSSLLPSVLCQLIPFLQAKFFHK